MRKSTVLAASLSLSMLLALPSTAAAQPKPKGKVPTAAELQGTWVYDFDASLAVVKAGGLPESVLAQVRPELEKNVGTTYTFKGDTTEVHSRNGDAKGTWRLENGDLVIKTSGREERLKASLQAPGQLVLSMYGMGQVFKKR